MRITISTDVKSPIDIVWAGFDASLFKKLAPPFPPADLLRFDGSLPGDEVHIKLRFFLFNQVWMSRITEQRTLPDEIYFVDEGFKLPFFLKAWRHKHRIVRHGTGSRIIEEIDFQTPSFLPNWLFYPILYGQFFYRKPIYRRVFSS